MDLAEKYNLKDIADLKVGHHESETSSSKNLSDEITPKYFAIKIINNVIKYCSDDTIIARKYELV